MTIATVAQIVKAVKAIDYQSDYRFDKIESVAFDTRKLGPHSLFVPLKGQRDGHEFIQEAMEKGARAVLWSRTDFQPPEGICTIWVDDTLESLQALAAWYLQEVSPQVIGITGSSGKTTSKDMVAAILATHYAVYKTQGNYNNEIGLPQTILDMPRDTQYLVLEMGMSDFGEIAFLSKLAKPSKALITMIGESHLEQLGSREGIAKAKLEILLGMPDGGQIVYPGGEALLQTGIEQASKPSRLEAYPFGQEEADQLYATHIVLQDQHTDFLLHKGDVTYSVHLPVLGVHNVSNALGAIQMGLLCGLSMDAILQGLADFQLTKNRVEWRQGPMDTRILNDAYNASPVAMKSVIQSFSQIPVDGRRILVLGDIRELGAQGPSLHASIATAIDPDHIQMVYLFGPLMHHLYLELEDKFDDLSLFWMEEDKQGLYDAIQAHRKAKDTYLVKSSNGTGLLELVDWMTREG